MLIFQNHVAIGVHYYMKIKLKEKIDPNQFENNEKEFHRINESNGFDGYRHTTATGRINRHTCIMQTTHEKKWCLNTW